MKSRGAGGLNPMRRISWMLAAAVAILVVAFQVSAQTAAQAPATAPNHAPGQAASKAPTLEETQFLKTAEVFVRKLFGWGPDFQLKLGPLSNSPAPDFYLVPIQVTFNGTADTGILYIS